MTLSTASFDAPAPAWMSTWPRVAPHPTRSWTIGDGRRYGLFDPATGQVTTLSPMTDAFLPALCTALDGGELVAYRHHRRAVVRRADRYVKVVRPQRVDDLVMRHERAANQHSYASPTVLAYTHDGRVDLAAMPGTSLHDTIRHDEAPPVHDIAQLLVNVASTDASALPGASVDGPQRWIETVARIEPGLRSALADVAATLPAVDVAGDAFVHGDLHDKNIFVAPHHASNGLGVIDLDGASRGAPEIDVANLAVHLELRAIQVGRPLAHTAEQLINAVRANSDVDLPLFHDLQRHTWFRLACLYRCRPASRHLTPVLLDRCRPREP